MSADSTAADSTATGQASDERTVDLSAVLSKVKKLRNLAESAARLGNVHEAEAATTQAARLLERYRIEEALLEETSGEDAELAEESKWPLYVEEGRATLWRQVLASTIAKHHGVAVYGLRGREFSIKLIGRRSDIAIVRYLFAWLSADFQTIASINSNGRGKTWINNFLLGACTGLRLQFERAKAEERAQNAMQTTALARLDSRFEEAAALLPENLKTVQRKGSAIDYNAFSQGKRHGETVSLNDRKQIG